MFSFRSFRLVLEFDQFGQTASLWRQKLTRSKRRAPCSRLSACCCHFCCPSHPRSSPAGPPPVFSPPATVPPSVASHGLSVAAWARHSGLASPHPHAPAPCAAERQRGRFASMTWSAASRCAPGAAAHQPQRRVKGLTRRDRGQNRSWCQRGAGGSMGFRTLKSDETPSTPETTQGQMDGFFSQHPYKCHQNRVASVGD